MKTLTKKAIVLASAIAVAGTFAVCAAGYGTDNDGKIYPTATEKTVTVPFVTDVQGTEQITILAYYNTPVTVDGVTISNETPDANNIVFIDQVQKDTTTGTITFSLRETDPTVGTYKVLMGGTGVTTAGQGTFTLEPTATGSTISGTVNEVAYFGNLAELEEYNTLWKTSVTLMDSMGNEIKKVDLVPATFDEMVLLYDDVAFSFDGLTDGEYMIAVSRKAMATKYLLKTVDGNNIDIGNIALLGADTMDEILQVEDGVVDGTDVANVIYKMVNLQYSESYDSNVDYQVDGTDLARTVQGMINFSGYQYWD